MHSNALALVCLSALVAGSCAPGGLPPAGNPVSVSPSALGPAIGLQSNSALTAAIADISATQIRATDSALVSFGTRHAMSDTLSPTRGIGAARHYLYNKLSGYSQ